MTATLQKFLIRCGIFGTFQFLILVHLAMYLYAGGTIHQPNLEGYSFTSNFFSDLGRNNLPNRTPNVPAGYIFRATMALTGICVSLFFLAVPSLFRQNGAKVFAFLATFFGVVAGICYIGIGNVPYDVGYWEHRYLVRSGFVSFLLMTIFYTTAIFLERNYPNRYAWLFIIFGGVLAVQIAVMLLGPRSWQSAGALYLQAVAQKIVVYAEVVCMLVQAIGALQVLRQKQT